MDKVAILGAGIAGYGAAQRLEAEGLKPVVYEKMDYPGGLCASHERPGGFVFDDGPHISFTKEDRIQELFAENVNNEYESVSVLANNHWRGHWIKHPAQCNLHGLPTDLLVDILRDFIEARQTEPKDPANYAEWLVSAFGKTFAETFPMQYGLKFHTTTADNMSLDWLGPRLYVPELEQVLRGALSPETESVHYIKTMRYPTHGGYVSYLRPFIDGSDIRLDHEVSKVDTSAKTLHFKNGETAAYDHIVSSMPLPDLIPMISNAPADVVAAAGRLTCSSVVLINVGIDREDISDHLWTYFYDDDYMITRISFPHMQSPECTPPGVGSIQAEIYFSKKYRPLDKEPDALIEPAISDLRRCGLIKDSDNIVFSEATLLPYANVIFDLERADALACVQQYLKENGIFYCGRFADWDYIWSDQSFISGENAAQGLLDKLSS